ncbi:hypothetical protein [Spirosoma fluminis]
MIVLQFSCLDPESKYQECMYGTPVEDLQSGFEAITSLINEGWQLLQIQYRYTTQGAANWIILPSEAFDGQPIKEPIERLQGEWEHILYSTNQQP